MRIVIITSCTGKKVVHHDSGLTIHDFRAGPTHIAQREREIAEFLTLAEDMYVGQQHLYLMQGVRFLREHYSPLEVEMRILSAGYGLVPAHQLLAPYECTFQSMKKDEARAHAALLNIPTDVRRALYQPYDLALVLLGGAYLDACALDKTVHLGGPTLFFCGPTAAAHLPRLPHMQVIALSHQSARDFSCGLVSLKGKLAARLLMRIAEDGSIVEYLCDSEATLRSFCRSSLPLSKDPRGEKDQVRHA